MEIQWDFLVQIDEIKGDAERKIEKLEAIAGGVQEVLGVYREKYRKYGKISQEDGVGVFRELILIGRDILNFEFGDL